MTTCSSCVHYKLGPAHEKFAAPCATLGVRDYAIAPEECYSPDPSRITTADIDLPGVGKMLRHLTGEQMEVLGHLFTQAINLQEVKLKFGQPMYVNLGNGPDGLDYITSYFKGYVVGMSHVKVAKGVFTPHVYLASDLSVGDDLDVTHRTLLRMMPSSLMNVAQFKVRREELVEAGRMECVARGWKMPLGQWLKAGCPGPAPELPNVYEPPTLDSAPASWLEPFSVEELESVKAISRSTRTLRSKDTPEEVTRKKAMRAEARANLVTTVQEDGTIVVSSRKQESTMPKGKWVPIQMPVAVR